MSPALPYAGKVILHLVLVKAAKNQRVSLERRGVHGGESGDAETEADAVVAGLPGHPARWPGPFLRARSCLSGLQLPPQHVGRRLKELDDVLVVGGVDELYAQLGLVHPAVHDVQDAIPVRAEHDVRGHCHRQPAVHGRVLGLERHVEQVDGRVGEHLCGELHTHARHVVLVEVPCRQLGLLQHGSTVRVEVRHSPDVAQLFKPDWVAVQLHVRPPLEAVRQLLDHLRWCVGIVRNQHRASDTASHQNWPARVANTDSSKNHARVECRGR